MIGKMRQSIFRRRALRSTVSAAASSAPCLASWIYLKAKSRSLLSTLVLLRGDAGGDGDTATSTSFSGISPGMAISHGLNTRLRFGQDIYKERVGERMEELEGLRRS